MNRDEQFYQACTTLPYPEVRDERDETSVPELERLSVKLEEGQRDNAIGYGQGLMRHYPDNDLVPTAVGTLLTQQNRAQEVGDLLRAALPRCPRRYRLYAMAGQADLALNHLANASVWWSRSVIAQCQVIDYQVYTPFYNLAHVAVVLDAFYEAESLLAMSSAIAPDAPHFSPTLEEILEPLRLQWVAEPLRRVLQHTEEKYLHGQR
jgi:hypothetical protein